MKSILVTYYSIGGSTEKMARYVAEGIRFSGQTVVLKKISDIASTKELQGYDGYLFGSPTYNQDIPDSVRPFLGFVREAGLAGKPGGAFGAYTHDVAYRHDINAPGIIMDFLQNVCDMLSFELGPLNLNEATIDTGDGIRACQDYGKEFGEKLGGE